MRSGGTGFEKVSKEYDSLEEGLSPPTQGRDNIYIEQIEHCKNIVREIAEKVEFISVEAEQEYDTVKANTRLEDEIHALNSMLSSLRDGIVV